MSLRVATIAEVREVKGAESQTYRKRGVGEGVSGLESRYMRKAVSQTHAERKREKY